jgi:hypothetical protein
MSFSAVSGQLRRSFESQWSIGGLFILGARSSLGNETQPVHQSLISLIEQAQNWLHFDLFLGGMKVLASINANTF